LHAFVVPPSGGRRYYEPEQREAGLLAQRPPTFLEEYSVMRPLAWFFSAALAALSFGGTAQAQRVVVRTPYAEVRVGPGVFVDTPYVGVGVGPGVFVRTPHFKLFLPRRMAVRSAPYRVLPPLPAARPEPEKVQPQGEPLPAPRAIPALPAQRVRLAAPPARPLPVLTPAEFVRSFVPAEGHYDVMLRHPFTGKAVKVSFTLPPGKPRKVRVSRLRMQFVYGRQRITVRFFRNGTVRVRS
jgi:hypothetical protein